MIFAHDGEAPAFNGYVGSPMYEVIPEHAWALVLVVITLLLGWLLLRFSLGSGRLARTTSRYRSLESRHRVLFVLLAVSAASHVGLVLGHEPSGASLLYGLGAVAIARAAYLLIIGRRWRRYTRFVLVAVLLAYAVSSFGGAAPDQVGIATKLVEIVALGIALQPVGDGRIRRSLASALVVFTVFITGLAAWVGAMASGEGGHHLGEVPGPGVLVPEGEDRLPTAHEQAEADALYDAVLAGSARYRDVGTAAADGYDVEGIYGTDFHASNDGYKADGRVLDPERPENLIYAMGPEGPVLIGVMFEVEGIRNPGPAVGGPLTVWHAHDHICLSPLPPFLTGVVSPFGSCPVGAFTFPITNEMIHVWTLPGVPERFGDLEDEWLANYLEQEA